ncbi:hypothetical protein SS50377_24514 [Spironucleus salmonicida]|uniref:Uncharacterized protein n=1 Tax=Spironucleus salmonicida TaxID=348837 RepID=V6LNX3_9EUKA|nr:hypothetical protein SS50377_24514 [Spironucleus salmonicida]|eukprot:EST45943.1 Hypothetical protein SS50377_13922 [Spironucleus salmonicida]
MPHNISIINTNSFIVSEKYPEVPQKILAHLYNLKITAQMQKYLTKYNMNPLHFSNIFQCDQDRLKITVNEDDETQEQQPEETKQEDDQPQIDLNEQQSIILEDLLNDSNSRLHSEILNYYLILLKQYLLSNHNIVLQKINFVGVVPQKVESFKDLFKEYELDFISIYQADLSSFVIKNKLYQYQKILMFSFNNNFPCYKYITIDITKQTDSIILPFVEVSQPHYFDPRIRPQFQELITFDGDGNQIVPDGYKPYRFRKTIKQQFREQLRQIIKVQESDVKFIICDELFISSFESFREPSRERLLFDVRTLCETWNFNLTFRRLDSFDVQTIPVYQRLYIIKDQPAFFKEQTARFLYQGFYSNKLTQQAIENRKLVDDIELTPSTSLFTGKITTDKDLDKFLQQMFEFINRIKLQLTDQITVNIAVGDTFLKTLRPELQEEFVEEEQEQEEIEEIEEEQKETVIEEQNEPQEQDDEKIENIEEKAENDEEIPEKEEQPPVPPKKPDYIRSLLKEITQNLTQLETKKIKKNKIKYTQQDILVSVSGKNISVVQNISSRIVNYVKLIGGIASDVFSTKLVDYTKQYLYTLDIISLKQQSKFQVIDIDNIQNYEAFSPICLKYQTNSRTQSGQFIIFQSESCKNFKQVEKLLKMDQNLNIQGVILAASQYKLVDQEIAQNLVNLDEPIEYEDVDDAEEPEEVEEEPEEEKFLGEEEEQKEGDKKNTHENELIQEEN